MYFSFVYQDLTIQVSTLDDSDFILVTIVDPTENFHHEMKVSLTALGRLHGMLSVLLENTESK